MNSVAIEAAEEESASFLTRSLDSVAVFLSALCLVHCIALPALAALVPMFATEFFTNERFHLWLLVAVLPTSMMALVYGVRRHHHLQIMGFGLIGLALITGAALGRTAGLLGENGDRWLSVLGGLILAAVHLRNFRLLHTLHHPHH